MGVLSQRLVYLTYTDPKSHTDPNSNVPFAGQSIYKYCDSNLSLGQDSDWWGQPGDRPSQHRFAGRAALGHRGPHPRGGRLPSSESTWTVEAGADAGFWWQLTAHAACGLLLRR